MQNKRSSRPTFPLFTRRPLPLPPPGFSKLSVYVTALHPSTNPHLFYHPLVLDHQSSDLQYLLQCFENTLKRRLRTFLLREACNSDVGAAAAVEQGVEFGGYR